LRIGTWNVLSLYRPGASNILKQEVEKVRMDLVEFQEIRWLGNYTLEKKRTMQRGWESEIGGSRPGMEKFGGDYSSRPRPCMGCSAWVDGWMDGWISRRN
jgi:hypothetical protein